MSVGARWALALLLAGTAAAARAPPPSGAFIPGSDGTPRPADAGPLACAGDEWPCGDESRCVPAGWRCDGRVNCPDGSDEMHCQLNVTCGPNQFQCAHAGFCIAASWRCDGDPDCGAHDASDEDPYMCQEDFKCPGNQARCATPVDGAFECAPVQAFCDGARDCTDGSDEWDVCDNFTSAQCAGLGCALGCRPTPQGLGCFCASGYEPKDGKCVDHDECGVGGACAQQCRNAPGSFSCACAPGYLLNHDNTTCTAINDPPNQPLSLIVVTSRSLRRLPPAPPAPPPTPANNVTVLNVRAIDVNYSNRTVCYIHHNMSRSALVCLDADNFTIRHELPAPTLFPDITSVSHLRIDWISNNWYFADEARGALYVCTRSLRRCRLLAQPTAAAAPAATLRALQLDPTRGLMFWSVWGGGAPGVVRADLAGRGATPLVRLNLVYPAALALDLAASAVYWLDSYLDCVDRARYDGTERTTIRNDLLRQEVRSIAVLEETLYLAVWGNRSVAAVGGARPRPRPRARPRPRPRLTPLNEPPSHVLIYHRQAQPLVDHPCRVSNGGCAHVCVPLWEPARAHCLCAHGYRLHKDKHCIKVSLETYILVARGAPPMVGSLPLEGAGAGAGADWEPLPPLTDVARPAAPALHQETGWIYFSNVGRYEIVRQQLDGSRREVFMGEDVDNVEGLAIDWMGRNLYWTDDALGQVSCARLDAPAARRVLVQQRGYEPRSIALHPALGMMYWAVWAGGRRGGAGRIEAADMAGQGRQVLVEEDTHWPNGLTIDYATNTLYWCDTHLQRIEKFDLGGGRRALLLAHSAAAPVRKPYGLVFYEGTLTWSELEGGGVVSWSRNTSTVLRRLRPPLYDLSLVSLASQSGTNGCSVNNGGCAELCLATPAGPQCACAGAHNSSCGAPAPPTAPPCPKRHFHCGGGQCIDAQYVCDGDADCRDARDEHEDACANVKCSEEQFKCDSSRCVPAAWLCDGLKDCADGSDEALSRCGAAGCGPAQVQCAGTRRCVPAAWRCDGAPDCGPGDGSDEADCEPSSCEPLWFRCGAGAGACVPPEARCDGAADCADGSDEALCPPGPGPTTNENITSVCEDHEFQCNNGECIRKEFHCDSHVDCLDGSDEAVCAPAAPPAAPAPTPALDPVPACPAPALSCDGGVRCVPLHQQCDGDVDCDDGADEADRCGEPQCDLSACSHTCHATPRGPACSCPPPLLLQRDQMSCGAAHACQDWGVCSQLCQPLKHRYRCACYAGYRLADDGFTCKSTDPTTPLLVFSNRHEIRGVELPGAGGAEAGAGAEGAVSRPLVQALKNTVALDWWRDPDSNETLLFWTDVVDDNIYRGTLTATGVMNIETVVESGLATAEGLAVEWAGRNLYWVESALHQIEVARLDGAHRRTLVAGGMDSPRALALDPARGYLFWSDWEASNPRIERCTLGGGARSAVVTAATLGTGAWPNGVALDHRVARLYWIDARSDSIHTTTYEGADHRVVLRGAAWLSHPFAVCVFEGHVYWTDWRSNSVLRAGKWAGGAPRPLLHSAAQPFDLKIIHPSRQPPLEHNPCAAANGGCSHLCLLEPGGLRSCACPHVMRLRSDNTTCEKHEVVLLVGRAGSLRGVDPDAPLRHNIPALAGPLLPADIAAHPNTSSVYWADTETNEIRRSLLTRGGASVVVETGLAPLRALALDPAGGVLYYAAQRGGGGGGALYAAGLAGERTALLLDKLQNVSTLAVHPYRGRLYWSSLTDNNEVVESAACDGTAREVLLRLPRAAAGRITSMAVDLESDTLFWVNGGANTIEYYGLRSQVHTTLPLGAGARPAALALWGARLLWADAGSGQLRSCLQTDCSAPKLLSNNSEGVVSLLVYDARTAATGGACAAPGAPRCQHLCVPTGGATARCLCAIGFTPRPGGRCEGIDEALVWSSGGELGGAALAGGAAPLPPVAGLGAAAALDFHAAGGWLYWADAEGGAVWRMRRDGTERTALVAPPDALDQQPSDWLAGLAVDWVAGNVYWSEPRRALLLAARLDGSHATVLLDTDPFAVTSICVDGTRGYLVLAGGGWVLAARTDASSSQQLYNGTAVADLALDVQSGYVYWLDAWQLSVWRARYDGAGAAAGAGAGVARELVRRGAGAGAEHPVAIAVHAGKLYWMDTLAGGGSVLAAPLTNTSDVTVIRDQAGDTLRDLMVWSSSAQTAPTAPAAPAAGLNPCRAGNGGCAALCLWGGGAARCRCPHGEGPDCKPYKSFLLFSRVTKIDSINLQDEAELNAPYPPIQDKELMRNVIALAYEAAAGRVFYSDIQRGTINSVPLNGTRAEVLLPQTGSVEGLSYVGSTQTLYWTSSSAAAVLRAHVPSLRVLPLSARAQHVRRVAQLAPGDRPRGIDVDPCEDRVYWTNWNSSRPSIQRAYGDGFGLQAVISTLILVPNALALDVTARRLYWADARLDKIERAHLDGSHRHIVISGQAAHPFSLCVWGGWVFWSDWVWHGVWRAAAADGAGATPLRKQLLRPMGLACASTLEPTCTADPCAVLNGGCAQVCTAQAHTALCSCRAGFQLAHDAQECEPVGQNCTESEFSCAEGGCVPAELACDGVPHCSSGAGASDEGLFYCTSRACPPAYLRCGGGGRCVPPPRVCDGRADCDDAADERGCDCTNTQMQCDDGTCVPAAARCDGAAQCPDGSDERRCGAHSCGAQGARRCAGAGCYQPLWRCDGVADCQDGSDEADCEESSTEEYDDEPPATTNVSTSCAGDEFRCGSGECVPLRWRCDQYADCGDGSDEGAHCSRASSPAPPPAANCSSSQFSCYWSGACVPAAARCDGRADCARAEDEAACACPPGSFRCPDPPLCLDSSSYCDGVADCAGGADEPAGCTPAAGGGAAVAGGAVGGAAGGCAGGAVRCAGRCVEAERVCDGRDHCEDGGGGGAGTDEDPTICGVMSPDGLSGLEGAVRGRCPAGGWRCANAACVDAARRCDGNDDCGDYSDEMHCNVNECLVRNGGCAHNCTDLVVGHRCWCRAGWRAGAGGGAGAGAGGGCRDVDECREDEPCDHICRNTLGSFVCSCRAGQRLLPDGVSCAPISDIKPSLIFTNRYFIRRVPLPDSGAPGGAAGALDGAESLLAHNLSNAVALDFDWRGGCLYWSDVTRLGSSLERQCAGAEPVRQVLHDASLQNPDGLAVDWVAGNLYWCDKGTDTLSAARLDGSRRRVLLRGPLQEPRAVALLPQQGYVYWSDWGTAPHIGRAGMDGSAPALLVTRGLGWPNALTLLPATSELYFADAREDYVAVADLDGRNVRVLFSRETMPWLRLHHVFALAVHAGRVYWSDWETRSVESCRRRPLAPRLYLRHANTSVAAEGGAWRCRSVAETVHKPMDLRLYHPSRQPPAPALEEACAALNCTGLCLLRPDGAGGARAGCACPEHWALQADGRSCSPNCTRAHFVCQDSMKCIPYWWRCDTQDDCGDGSDERGPCPAFRCAPGQLQCGGGGGCLHPALLCDGEPDCADGADERDCEHFACLSGQWKCPANATLGSGARCVAAARRCDGADDCPDGADERDCPPRTCPPDHLSCGSGECVPVVWACDGDRDCADGSDEGARCAGAACPPRYFRCRAGRCVPRAWLCDTEADCNEGEDEEGCEADAGAGAGEGAAGAGGCEPTYFRCGGGRCLPGRWRCDHERDCPAGEDERGCHYRNCTDAEFRCASGECVRTRSQCAAEEEEALPPRAPPRDRPPRCRPHERPCHDARHCFPRQWQCDGLVDCVDGSDEAACPAPAPPPPPGAPAPAACPALLPGGWRCDGRPDCAARLDEDPAYCAAEVCMPTTLRCGDNTCVPRALACDGVPDCKDGADEHYELCRLSGVRARSCREDELLCGAQCLRADKHDNCTQAAARPQCDWRACPHECRLRHDNYTCKCGGGYKQHAADGAPSCEAAGALEELLCGGAGALRGWQPRGRTAERRDARVLLELGKTDGNATTPLTALAAGGGALWWAAGGRVLRAALAATLGDAPLQPELFIPDAGSVTGLAVEGSTRLLYYCTRQDGAGAVLLAARGAGAAQRRTLHKHAHAHPAAIVVNTATSELFFADSGGGGQGGVWRCPLGGCAPAPAALLRARRVSALALDAPAQRLYFVDGYYDTLETIKVDGSARALVALFSQRPAGAPPPLHYNYTFDPSMANASRSLVVPVAEAACWSLAAGGGAVWCGGRRGAARLSLPARPAALPPAARPRQPKDSCLVLALSTTNLANDTQPDPCVSPSGAPLCAPGAICVLRGAGGVACVCADGLEAQQDGQDELSVRCSAPRAEACAGGCGAGRCVGGRCRCPALLAGALCQRNRCAGHCLHRGHCQLDPRDNNTLMCICREGYTGARCSRPPPLPAPPAAPPASPPSTPAAPLDDACRRVRCENGGYCKQRGNLVYCECPQGYTGSRCAECAAWGAAAARRCGAREVCARGPGAGGPRCLPAAPPPACDNYCFNEGACSLDAGGAPRCACAGAWGGARCDVRATTEPAVSGVWCDVDAACAHGGSCVVRAGGGAVCACAGGWGGPRCAHYVGHDAACHHRDPPCRADRGELCVWANTLEFEAPSATYCACRAGAACAVGAGAGAGGGAGAGAGAALAVLALLSAVAAAAYVLHRRRRGVVRHARLADNVEISNPMYLGGADDDEPPRAPGPPPAQNGGNHFANPVYDSMYAPRGAAEEHANLLEQSARAAATPPPAERAALL